MDLEKNTMEINIPGDIKGTILGKITIPNSKISRILTKKGLLQTIKNYLIMRTIYPAIDKCTSNQIAGLLGCSPTNIRKLWPQIREAVREFDIEENIS